MGAKDKGSTVSPSRKLEQRHCIQARRLPSGDLVDLPQPAQQIDLRGAGIPACNHPLAY